MSRNPAVIDHYENESPRTTSHPPPVWACLRMAVWTVAGMLTILIVLLMLSIRSDGLPGRADIVCVAVIVAVYSLARAATFMIDGAASLMGVRPPGP